MEASAAELSMRLQPVGDAVVDNPSHVPVETTSGSVEPSHSVRLNRVQTLMKSANRCCLIPCYFLTCYVCVSK
jgi:hypothetical protein